MWHHQTRDDARNAKPVSLTFPASSTAVRLGWGVSGQMQEAACLQGKNVLMVADRAVTALGLHREMRASLEKAATVVGVFDDIQAEPEIATVERAAAIARQCGAQAVVGIGGGSAMDTAKLTALTLTNDADVLTMMRQVQAMHDPAPLVLLPTTSGTGSEISPYAVVTAPSGKVFATSDKLFARMALVDPKLTVSAPPRVTAATGLDALTHAIEGAMGAYSPYSAALAAACIRITFAYLPRAVQNGSDEEARCQLSWASVMGMLAYMQGGGLYAHSTSYVLSALDHVPHGVGCGVALPYCLQYCREEILPLAEQLGQAIGLESPTPEALAGALQGLLEAVQLPASLQAMHIPESALPALAEAMVTAYPRAKNPRSMDAAQAEMLLRAMHAGSLALVP